MTSLIRSYFHHETEKRHCEMSLLNQIQVITLLIIDELYVFKKCGIVSHNVHTKWF